MIYKRDKQGFLQHISAGGLVYRMKNNQPQVLLLYRKDFSSWHLPKGTISRREKIRQAAKREIIEETGLDVKIEDNLGNLQSQWFDGWANKKELINKTTHYFLAKAVNFRVKLDFEHDQYKWVSLDQAEKLLAKHQPYQILAGKKIWWEDESKIIPIARQKLNEN